MFKKLLEFDEYIEKYYQIININESINIENTQTDEYNDIYVDGEKVVHSKPNGDKVTDKVNFESAINESINPMIQALIDNMIKEKIQQKTITIKDKDKFNQFIKDSETAVNKNLLIIKENPVVKNEVWISLGPAAINKMF